MLTIGLSSTKSISFFIENDLTSLKVFPSMWFTLAAVTHVNELSQSFKKSPKQTFCDPLQELMTIIRIDLLLHEKFDENFRCFNQLLDYEDENLTCLQKCKVFERRVKS